MYSINRHILPVLTRKFENNKILSLSGARQVGKSTLIEYAFNSIKRVSFDNKIIKEMAVEDGKGFLDSLGVPLFIDEAQKVESIFEDIKDKIDTQKLGYKSYILSGSQKLKLKNGEETLAGRISTNELSGLSLREIFNVNFYESFLPSEGYLQNREKHLKKYENIWNVIHRGQFPELYENPNKDWEDFYQSYVNTYIERDVAGLISNGNSLVFIKFMTCVAARTGNVLNYANLASEVGVNETTIATWIDILVRSNVVYLLKPYYSSCLNRAIKSPKIYFRDTGLCCYLTRWLTPDTAKTGAMSGALFETFVVNEIIKTYSNAGKSYDFSLFYYRGKDKIRKKIEIDGNPQTLEIDGEIDLIIQDGENLYPIEIKETSNPNYGMTKMFDVLDKEKDKKRVTGFIICTYPDKIMIKKNLYALPIEYI